MATKRQPGALTLSEDDRRVLAARAAGLAAPRDPTAAVEEIRWQLSHALPAVREVLRRLPPPTRSAGPGCSAR